MRSENNIEPSLEFKRAIKTSGNSWYRVVERLGVGGSAVTYLVLGTEGPVNGALYAMKLFRMLGSESRKRRFLKEIKFLKQNDHPSIMRLTDFGSFIDRTRLGEKSYPFFVAEYLPRTLYDVIRENQASFVEKSSYIVQLLSALDHISSLGSPVIHRDIKPQNIFVKGKTCLLGDFGLMTRLTVDQEKDRGVLSQTKKPAVPYYYRTPDLVALERDGKKVTPASDIFQLGLVAAQLFTGRNPCIADANVLNNVKLEPIWEVPGKQGKGVRLLLKRMLEMNPEKRPVAKELLDPWREVFWEASKTAIELNGKAF